MLPTGASVKHSERSTMRSFFELEFYYIRNLLNFYEKQYCQKNNKWQLVLGLHIWDI